MPADLSSGRQQALTPDDRETVLYSVMFRLWSTRGSAHFSELGGIVSEIEQTEYMEAGPAGAQFSRHPGRTKSPTVVLKRAARTGPSTTWLWTWHQASRRAATLAKDDCWLELYGPTDSLSGVPRMTYGLLGAWPSKLELGGLKAGGTEILIQTVTLQCDELIDMAVV